MRRRHFIAATTTAAMLTTTSLPLRAAGASKAAQTLLVLGDSLSAEYGLVRGQGWVALLETRLVKEAPSWKVVNASISGETTSGGRSRLPGLLEQHGPKLIVIELGGNDALRGLSLTSTEDNLRQMVQSSKKNGANVLLLGMQVPPNYGQRYGKDFAALYTVVAREEKVPVLPFFLAGVGDGPQAADLFQADRIHPLAKAHPRMLENVWPLLKPLLT